MDRIEAVFIYKDVHYVGYKLQAIPRIGDELTMYKAEDETDPKLDVECWIEGRVKNVHWLYERDDNDTTVHITIEPKETDE